MDPGAFAVMALRLRVLRLLPGGPSPSRRYDSMSSGCFPFRAMIRHKRDVAAVSRFETAAVFTRGLRAPLGPKDTPWLVGNSRPRTPNPQLCEGFAV